MILSGCLYNDVENTSSENKDIIYRLTVLPKDFSDNREDIDNLKEIYSGLFQGLVTLDEKGEVMPDMSKSFEILSDGLEYRFTLRKDIYRSDGRKITSLDFLNFFKEALSGERADYLSENLKMVYGVMDYHNNKTSFSRVAIKAPDEDTLVFRLNYKSEDFLEILSRREYYLRDFNSLKNLKEDYGKTFYTGSFYIDSFEEGKLILKRNPYYYDKSSSLKSNIVLIENLTKESILADINIELCDLFQDPPLSQLRSLEEKVNINKSYKGITYGMSFNEEVTDKELRKAIEKALYLGYLTDETGDLSFGEYTYGKLVYNKAETKEDTLRASVSLDNNVKNTDISRERLLAEEYLKTSVVFSKDNTFILGIEEEDKGRRIGEFTKNALEKYLGLKVQIVYLSKEEFIKAVEEGKYDAYIEAYNGKTQESLLEDESNKEKLLYVPLFYDFKIVCSQKNIKGIKFDNEGGLILKELNKVDIKDEENKEDFWYRLPIG